MENSLSQSMREKLALKPSIYRGHLGHGIPTAKPLLEQTGDQFYKAEQLYQRRFASPALEEPEFW